MDYASGQSLRDLVSECGPQTYAQTRALLEQMAEVLDYLHSQAPSVVHQDFTPDNIIVCPDGTIRVIDFSVARQSFSHKTATVVGKQAFIAPEQFRGTPTAQSDLYSLGATIYFVLTGSEPTPISQSELEASADNPLAMKLSELVRCLASYEAEDRIPDAKCVLDAIRRLDRS